MSQPAENELIDQASAGDASALGQLVGLHEGRIKRMIAVRMDPRIKGRMDPSDVFQELQLDVIRRIPEYAEKREVSFFEWLRFLARQKLAELSRRHMQTQARDVRREQNLLPESGGVSSIALASFLIGDITSPSMQVAHREVKTHLDAAIASLDEIDREVLLLRHAEQLSSVEAAAELGLPANTFRQRYLRALKRLKSALQQHGLNWSVLNG
jgi:RNA polymerase sigma-70 factor (ECF subfamily)